MSRDKETETIRTLRAQSSNTRNEKKQKQPAAKQRAQRPGAQVAGNQPRSAAKGVLQTRILEGTSGDFWHSIKHTDVGIIGSQKEKREKSRKGI